jgi:hypothetical protein
LVIIDSLKVWWHLLEGSKYNVVIHTNNMALKYFMSLHLLSHQQVSWAQFLAWFQFKIEYAPGKGNKADRLSHWPDYFGALEDTKEVVLLLRDHFINVAVSLLVPNFLERLQHLAPLLDLEEGWYVQDGLLCNAGDWIIMLDDVSLHTEIIWLTHDVPHMGHLGFKKMVELLWRNYHWPSLQQDVTEYIHTCIPCQQMKVFPSQASGLLSLLPPPKEPWEQITANFIVELPKSQGYDVILMAANCHTKHVYFVPSVLAVSTEGTMHLFQDHMWKHHRWAQKIITDQGT